MSSKFIGRQSLCARCFVRRLARSISGIAAVEFGLVAPLMIVMLIGTIEVSRAVSMDRRFGVVTTMVADLVSREKTIDSADLTAIYDIVERVMEPYDTSSLKISVIPVQANITDENDTKVYAATTNRPSYQGGTLPAQCSVHTLTSGMVDKGDNVIVVKTTYQYTPLLTGSMLGAATWNDEAILSPRNGCVDFDGNGCVTSSPSCF